MSAHVLLYAVHKLQILLFTFHVLVIKGKVLISDQPFHIFKAIKQKSGESNAIKDSNLYSSDPVSVTLLCQRIFYYFYFACTNMGF